MDGTIGEIRLFAGNFAPLNWAFCNGQVMAIAQNTALFSILGTTYGGNGTVTFGLPNFNGRAVVGAGQGPGLTQRDIGETDGSDVNVMTVTQMPPHTHTGQGTVNQAASTAGNSATPVNGYPAAAPADVLYYGSPSNALMGDSQVSITIGANVGGGQAFNNVQPYLGLNYIICLSGTFPSRP